LVHEISLEVCTADKSSNKNREDALPSADFACSGKSVIIQMSSLDKYVMQGLADRGQSRDPRNLVLRVITGLGSAATPLPVVIGHLGHSFIPGVASWNGPLVEAYKALFPDYTVNQVVRLSNSAFEPNKVVPKTNSAKMTIFVPLEMLMSKDNVRLFRKDPHEFFLSAVRNYRVLVEAQFITPVATESAKIQ
jgi:hypothetical protein